MLNHTEIGTGIRGMARVGGPGPGWSELLSLWQQPHQAEDLVFPSSRQARLMAGASAAVRPSEEAQGGCLARLP